MYLDLKYKPKRTDLICRFYVEPKKDWKTTLEQLPAESSIGTWTTLTTMKPRVRKLAAKVFHYDKKTKLVDVAYPLDIFEPHSIPQLLSDVAGNIFGMKIVKNLRLVDIKFPKEYVKSFSGPEFGIDGVRKILGTTRTRRPHVGTIVKPKIGLNPRETAKVAYEAWVGGVDFVKDDENLTSQKFCKFEDRVIKVLDALDKAEAETGEKKMYAPNITAPADTMLERAQFVKDHGGKCIMIDVITSGFSSVQYIRDQDLKMVIHAHRAMHAAFTRYKKHGIAMPVVAKLLRLIGVDQLHIGTVIGKLEGSKDTVLKNEHECEDAYVKGTKEMLSQNWYGLKPVFAVSSGGLCPLHVPKLIDMLGRDIVIQAGGGIHGHPMGTRKGAIAMRQAVDAALNGIPLKEYAKDHKELAAAIKKWGRVVWKSR